MRSAEKRLQTPGWSYGLDTGFEVKKINQKKILTDQTTAFYARK
jgi:hypothetical protein